MDFILELIGECLVDGAVLASGNKKLSKWIRYSLIAIIVSVYVFTFVALGTFSIFIMRKQSVPAGLILLAVSLFIAIAGVWKVIVFVKQRKKAVEESIELF